MVAIAFQEMRERGRKDRRVLIKAQLVPYNAVPGVIDPRSLGDGVMHMVGNREGKGGEDDIMRGLDEEVHFRAYKFHKTLRGGGWRKDHIKLAVTRTLASEMMVRGMTEVKRK